MYARIILVIAIFTIIGTGTVSAQDRFEPKVGDQVTIQLRDCAAGEYIRMTATGITATEKDKVNQDAVLVFQTFAIITQILPDGQIVLESSPTIIVKNGMTRKLTLSATVDPNDATTQITVRKSPVGTLVYSSPEDRHPVATRTESTMAEIDLSNARTELRSWVLADEVKFNQ